MNIWYIWQKYLIWLPPELLCPWDVCGVAGADTTGAGASSDSGADSSFERRAEIPYNKKYNKYVPIVISDFMNLLTAFPVSLRKNQMRRGEKREFRVLFDAMY